MAPWGLYKKPLAALRECFQTLDTAYRLTMVSIHSAAVDFLTGVAAAVRLAGVRLLRRPGRFVLAALGIAIGTAVLVGIQATTLAAQDRSLGRAVEQIGPANRAVRAVWGGFPAQNLSDFRRLDQAAHTALRTALRADPFRVVVFRQSRLGGAPVELAGIDGVARWVRITSGRLPRTCTVSRCEVVQVGGSTRRPRGTQLVVVGRGRLISALPLGSLLSTTTGSPIRPAVLVAAGVEGLADSRPLAYEYRAYGWVVPLTGRSLRPWSAERVLAGITVARSRLSRRDESFSLESPDDELRAASAQTRVAGRRLLLLGGASGALLLSFVVLAAAGMRRDVEAARRRLIWLGAGSLQLAAFQLAEAALVAVIGAVAGWLGGIGLGALGARQLGAPAGRVLVHSVLAPEGLLLVAAVATTGALVLATALALPSFRLGGAAVTVADVAAVGALVAVIVGLARGSADAASLAGGSGTGVFLLLLPGLLTFVAAVACARALAPALRGLERLGRRAPVSIRLPALSLARAPGRAGVVVTFLVVSLGIAFFAATYRATLSRSERDEAAYAVPADVVATEDLAKLATVTDVATPAEWSRRGEATPVLRLAGDLPGSGGTGGFTLLGIPAHAVPNVHGWRDDFADTSLAGLARRLEPRSDVALRGVRLPPRVRLLDFPLSRHGDSVRLTLDVQTPRGGFTTVDLGFPPPGRSVARARLSPAAAGGLVVGLKLEVPPSGLHDQENTGLAPIATGLLHLGALRANGHALAMRWRSWVGAGGASARAGVAAADLRYVVSTDTPTRYRVRQPTDNRAVPVIASPRVGAAAGGQPLTIEIEGDQLAVRVVGIAHRFPTASGDFVLADGTTVATALNAGSPGSAVTNEYWLNAREPTTAAALVRSLRRPPFDRLQLAAHNALAAELRSDPLGRGAMLALGGGAFAALALALLGLLLSLVFDVRDERGELADLEAQGAEPSLLRRYLRRRALCLGAFGALGGVATGLALAAFSVSLVRLTARASAPEPPLRLALDWPLVTSGLLVFALVGAGLVAVESVRVEVAR